MPRPIHRRRHPAFLTLLCVRGNNLVVLWRRMALCVDPCLLNYITESQLVGFYRIQPPILALPILFDVGCDFLLITLGRFRRTLCEDLCDPFAHLRSEER